MEDMKQVHCLVYLIFIIFFLSSQYTCDARKTKKNSNIDISTVMTVNVVLSFGISLLQFVFPTIIFSSLAFTIGVLIIYLYLQSTRKTTDFLTMLYNRDTLTYRLNKSIKQNKPFTLLVFSIRSFKSINERYGIEFGNELLIHIASTFKAVFEGHTIFRYSGDEFAVLIKDPNIDIEYYIETINNRYGNTFSYKTTERIIPQRCEC